MRRYGIQRTLDSTKRLLLLSACLLITFVLVIGSVYTLFSGIVEYQAALLGETLNAMLVKNVQSIQSSAKGVFDQMTLDGQLAKLLFYPSSDAGELLAGLRQLNAYRRSNPVMDSIYLYNPLNDSYYISSDHSTQAVQTRREMFDYRINDILDHLEAYENLQPIVRSITVSFPKLETLEYVTFIRYNTLNRQNPGNVLVINIRKEAFFQYVHPAYGMDSETILFLSGDEILLSAYAVPEDRSFLKQAIEADGGTGYYTDSAGSLVCYDKSFSPHWWLVYRADVDQGALLRNARGSLMRLQIVIGLVVVMLLLTAWLLIQWMRLFRRRTQALRAAEAERAHIRRQQRRQLLLRLLSAHAVLSGEEAEALLSQSGIGAMPPRPHRLMLWIFDGLEEKLRHLGMEEADGLLQTLCGFVADQLAGFAPLFAVHTEPNRVAVVIAPGAEAPLQTAVSALQGEAQARFGLRASAVESPPFENGNEIAEAYAWTLEALPYVRLLGPRVFLAEAEVRRREAEGIPSAETWAHGITAEMMLLHPEAMAVRLREALAALSAGSYRGFQISLSQLLAALDEAVNSLYQNNGVQRPTAPGGLWYAVDGLSTVQAIGEALTGALREAMEAVREKQDTRHEELLAAVDARIAQNFQDALFSQAQIADGLGLSAAHLGRVYKKYRGTTVAEAIGNARLAHAQALLRETNRPVSAVAAQSGYSDAQYFYRAFKRETGATPSAYRQRHRNAAQTASMEDSDE